MILLKAFKHKKIKNFDLTGFGRSGHNGPPDNAKRVKTYSPSLVL